MSRQTFFEHPVLERHLGHHFLQLMVLRAQLLDFVAGRFADRVPGQLLLARFEEVFAPSVIKVSRDALATAQLRDALLAPKPLECIPSAKSGHIDDLV
jgi:hypothetical protein